MQSSGSGMLVIPAEPGDPISAVFIDENYVASGSHMGKVWVYNIERNSRRMIAGFSEDAIRGLYIQDGTLYVTVGDQQCRQIRICDPYDQIETRFNRRSTSSGFKYVFQKFNQVTVFYPGMTTFIDVVTNSQSMCPFKLQQPTILNVCPVDCFQYRVLFSEFAVTDAADPPPRKFKIMDVSTGDLKWQHVDPGLTQARFISNSQVVYFSVNRLVILNADSGNIDRSFSNFHRSDVVAMDCSMCMGSEGKPFVASVGANGSVCVWNHESGTIVGRGTLSQFSFSLGNPYHVQARAEDARFLITVSDDNGVHYLSCARTDVVENLQA